MSCCTRWLCTPIVAIAVLGVFIAGCSSSDDGNSSGENSTMQTNQDDPDPNSLLASLEFVAADDDARHRCLLETFAEDAAGQELEELAPFDYRGTISRVWCSASGDDYNLCIRGDLMLKSPASEAVSVWAYRESNSAPITRYGYRGVHNPDDTAGVWSLYFERRLAGNDNGFFATFVPFVNGEKDFSSPRLIIKESFVYSLEGQGVDDITATLVSNETPQALLAALVESPASFEQLLVERLDALLADFETRVNGQTGLDTETRASAIEAARNELGAKRAVVTDNASELQALLQEQVAHDRCQ
jgi:hypothetical protein